MSGQRELLSDIEMALTAHGCTVTRFGYMATGDPGILKRLLGLLVSE